LTNNLLLPPTGYIANCCIAERTYENDVNRSKRKSGAILQYL